MRIAGSRMNDKSSNDKSRAASFESYAADCLDREARLTPLFAKPSLARYARRMTGVLLSGIEKLLSSHIRVEAGNVPETGPVLFVANHFTRFETFILPWLIDRHLGRNVHSLAHYKLFSGLFGDYLRSIGALSTRHPEIKHRIVEDLLTGRHDWLIYPEGSMIKNKKLWEKGKFRIEAPDRTGSPHTGSAVLALQVLMYGELYRHARQTGDQAGVELLERKFRFGEHASSRAARGGLPATLSIVPINITYYPMRPGMNLLYRLARTLIKKMPAVLAEELTIEGNFLLKETDINVYFGKPLDLSRYLELVRPALRRMEVGDQTTLNALLEALKHRVTSRLMSEIYSRLTINFDHLFCAGLRALKRDRVPEDDFHAALYLAARTLQARGSRRIHHTLGPKLLDLVSDRPCQQLDSMRGLAISAGVLSRRDGYYQVDQVALNRRHGFHDVRLKNPVQVLANELEPLRDGVHAVRASVNQPHAHVRERVAAELVAEDLAEYQADRVACATSALLKDDQVGRPFFLHTPGSQVGIVLSHGYLASPGEVRELANHLHRVGFSVYGVRLKGHGTAPEQLATVTVADWERSFARAYAVVKHSCRHVILGGFSAGGLLALLEAARGAGPVGGVFAINPSYQLADRASCVVPVVERWNRALRAVHLRVGRLDSVANAPAFADTNYTRNWLNGILELERLIERTGEAAPRVTVPTLVIQADKDPVVKPDGARRLYELIPAENKQLVQMAFNRHVIIRGEGAQVVHERVEEFVRVLAADLTHRYPMRMHVVEKDTSAAGGGAA